MDMAMPPTTTSSASSAPSSPPTSMSMTMSTTFFTSRHTPLFSASWTPRTTGQYAGTCIFLIVLAALFRGLVALRFNLFAVLARVRGHGNAGGFEEGGKEGGGGKRRWRASEAVWMAGMDVVVAGVGYLLMVAVMTMNVGYFMSVLAGVFLGSLVTGRFMGGVAAP